MPAPLPDLGRPEHDNKGLVDLYKGSFVGLSGGYARPLTAGDAFAGIAYEEVNNTGADGAASVRVFTLGDFELSLTGAASAVTQPCSVPAPSQPRLRCVIKI